MHTLADVFPWAGKMKTQPINENIHTQTPPHEPATHNQVIWWRNSEDWDEKF